MKTIESVHEMGLDFFLPRARMQELAAAAREAFERATPFPHVVLDDFFDPTILDRVLEEFPPPGRIKWREFDNEREIKLESSLDASFGPMTRLLLYHMNSVTFLDFLTRITGIENLIGDPCFEGGGLHQIVRGGRLAVHADFNKHRRYGLDRRLNVILYLNKDWREEYGGHLELWDRAMSHCEKRVLPVFNRLMIFLTTDFTYHGHPDPLRCPAHVTRKSLALYFFTNGRPKEETTAEHSSIFVARPTEDFKLTARQRIRHMVSDILPPIVARQLKRARR